MSHLVALADTRHFGAAAERCHLSQSAFSRSIQAAEAELGLQLFDRSQASVALTRAGAFVVERLRRVLFESRGLQRDVALYQGQQLGTLSFGVGPFPAAAFAPTLLVRLRQEFPGVQFGVEVLGADLLLERLRAEQIDFFLADDHGLDAADDLTVQPLTTLQAAYYVRPAHPLLAGGGPIGMAALVPYGLGSVRLTARRRQALQQQLDMSQPYAQMNCRPHVECDDVSVLLALARDTDTVVCFARGVLGEGHGLRRLDITDAPELRVEVARVTLRGRSLSPMAEFVAGLIGSRVA